MSDKFNQIEGTLVYVAIQEPVKAYVKPGAEAKPDEWKAGVVLTDEDFVDELEEYAKELDTQLSLKKVKSASFEDIYKCDLPEDAGKNVWVLTLRKSVELGKTGKAVPDKFRPRVFEKEGNILTDITFTKLVGNGSFGKLSVDRFDRTAGGSSLYLKNVLVTDLVEYIPTESDYQSGSEFDEGEVSAPKKAAPAKTEKAKPAAKKAAPKPKAKPETENDSDESEDDDAPW